jgi:hypothetical protein
MTDWLVEQPERRVSAASAHPEIISRMVSLLWFV